MSIDSQGAALDRPGEAEAPEPDNRVFLATQWQLMRWRFQRHRMAMAGLLILIVLYLLAIFCEFFAPHDPHTYESALMFGPPQAIRIVNAEGLTWPPFVYGIRQEIDPVTWQRSYVLERDRKYPVKLFVRGDPYKLWGVIEGDLHFLGTEADDAPLYLLGTDRLGRDVLSRIIYGARVSLSVGLLGVAISLVLGILIGGFSGYYGGLFDLVAQRLIEFIRSVPTLPLWMGLSAAVPPDWPPLRVYFAVTLVLSVIGWTGMARVVRGRFLALREEDFVMAAKLAGSSEWRIVTRHMVPSFMSHIIASVTLAIPGMILGETSLSFIGVGLRSPVISWGVMLKEAQALRNVAMAPWLLLPGLAVVLAVLSFNFVGDGVRDAADPYAR